MTDRDDADELRSSEDDTAVRFERRPDGSIVASTIVHPTSRDYALYEWLERNARLLNKRK